jgi:hypothetical protein
MTDIYFGPEPSSHARNIKNFEADQIREPMLLFAAKWLELMREDWVSWGFFNDDETIEDFKDFYGLRDQNRDSATFHFKEHSARVYQDGSTQFLEFKAFRPGDTPPSYPAIQFDKNFDSELPNLFDHWTNDGGTKLGDWKPLFVSEVHVESSQSEDSTNIRMSIELTGDA